MRCKATSFKRNGDLRDATGLLDMRADDEDEAKFLAELHCLLFVPKVLTAEQTKRIVRWCKNFTDIAKRVDELRNQKTTTLRKEPRTGAARTRQ